MLQEENSSFLTSSPTPWEDILIHFCARPQSCLFLRTRHLRRELVRMNCSVNFAFVPEKLGQARLTCLGCAFCTCNSSGTCLSHCIPPKHFPSKTGRKNKPKTLLPRLAQRQSPNSGRNRHLWHAFCGCTHHQDFF